MGNSKYYVSDISTTRVTPQKKTLRASQAKSVLKDTASHKRVQLSRREYWSQVKEINLKNLVFLDEMGVLLGLKRTHARAAPGERAYDYKPFDRGSKVSVIVAISVSKVLAVLKDTASHIMTLNDSMDSAAFQVYVSEVSSASALERRSSSYG